MSEEIRKKVMEEIIDFWINFVYGNPTGSLVTANNNEINLRHLKRIIGISELEKRINDSLLLPTIITHGRDHTTLTTQIAELKEGTNIWIQNYNTDLRELKEIQDEWISGLLKEQSKRKNNTEVLREIRQWVRDLIFFLKWTSNLESLEENDMTLEELLHRHDYTKLEGGEKEGNIVYGDDGNVYKTFMTGGEKSEFLKSWDYMMERIEFHTENPDSELMDEVREEYKKWEERKND